jgi:fatty-acyl-CoA synthase
MLTFTLGALLGATFVFPEKFDPEGSLALIEEHRATEASMVPVMLRRIASLPKRTRERYDVSSIRIILASGSALPEDLRHGVAELFGPVLHDLYGSTEAGSVAIATPEDMEERPGTVGRAVRGVEVAVFSPEGEELPAGESGELHIKSSMVFSGYTSGERAAQRKGYLSLGDMGYIDDDGYLFVEGRADDMVVIGGENVYPAEVEEAIRGVRGVQDVAVVGVPDRELEQVLAAFVVGTAKPEQIERRCRSELASFKVPHRIEIVDDLPRTSTGKVLRRELAEESKAAG